MKDVQNTKIKTVKVSRQKVESVLLMTYIFFKFYVFDQCIIFVTSRQKWCSQWLTGIRSV